MLGQVARVETGKRQVEERVHLGPNCMYNRANKGDGPVN